PLGEQIRELLLNGRDMSAWAEAALFAAARAELVQRVIAPALEDGKDVVCDRYIDSSLAYQGIARDLGVDRVLELNLNAAQRLLRAAIAEGPAHAYLFHGSPGVGKRTAALAFAAELIGEAGRVSRRAHPDLYLIEPVGDQIRIDDIRELRRDLHMRPFEAERRVYLLFSAETMNEDAADALLKDLEEPPSYAVIVLVANDLGPLPETIRSRCQPVP